MITSSLINNLYDDVFRLCFIFDDILFFDDHFKFDESCSYICFSLYDDWYLDYVMEMSKEIIYGLFVINFEWYWLLTIYYGIFFCFKLVLTVNCFNASV